MKTKDQYAAEITSAVQNMTINNLIATVADKQTTIDALTEENAALKKQLPAEG